MHLEYPYQLVAFLDNEPKIGEAVYYGENGWYPQIALKRRFSIADMSEKALFSKLAEYCDSKSSFAIETGKLIRPGRMPVRVLEVKTSPELMAFHNDLISFIGKALQSRYPERDGVNYLPHITAEYNDILVIDSDKYSSREFKIEKVFLLKDIDDENSVAYASFDLNHTAQR
jgi:hypothetical protein